MCFLPDSVPLAAAVAVTVPGNPPVAADGDGDGDGDGNGDDTSLVRDSCA